MYTYYYYTCNYNYTYTMLCYASIALLSFTGALCNRGSWSVACCHLRHIQDNKDEPRLVCLRSTQDSKRRAAGLTNIN